MLKLSDIRLLREAMRKLQRSLSWQWKSDAACCGITAAQCHALLEVGKSTEITLSDLSSILGLDNSTLSRTVDGMVKAGLVERQSSSEDRRYLNIFLTDRGKTVYDQINCSFDHFYREIIDSIPEEKQLQVIESIDLLAKAIAEADTDSTACCREEIIK
jgi:DNA-binding MarR family transcriptional regulator